MRGYAIDNADYHDRGRDCDDHECERCFPYARELDDMGDPDFDTPPSRKARPVRWSHPSVMP